jgi:hypothetical protein
MKMAQHIFALTKSEQRVIILILLALLVSAVTKHFRETRSHGTTLPSTIAEPSVRPESSSLEEEQQ